MKINIILLLVILTFGGCKHNPDPAPDPAAVQFAKLSGSWKATTATLNSVAQNDYDNLELDLSGNGNAAPYHYNLGGRPVKSPWPANGEWAFGEPKESVIVRDKGTPDELTLNYAVGDTALTITFTYTGDGYAGTRQSSVSGQWSFTFSKQ